MSNLHFFYGGDRFSMKDTCEIWEKEFTKKHGDLNITKLYGEKNLEVKKIITLSKALPFLAEKRLIIIYDFLAHSGNLSKEDLEGLKDFLKKEIPTSSVLLFVEKGNPDKRKSLFLFLKKTATVKEFISPEKDADVLSFLRGEFEKKGKVISPENLRFFLFRVGKDIGNLKNEVDKISCFCDEKEIKKEDIESVSQKNYESFIWTFLDILMRKKPQEVLEKFRDEISAGTEVQMIFFMIARQFRLMLEANSDSKSESPAFKKMAPWAKKKLVAVAKKIPKKKLLHLHEKLLKIDLGTKTGLIKVSADDNRMFVFELEKFLLEWCLS